MHELETLLSRLKMEHLGYHVESLLEQAAKKELNYREFLCMALQQEWNGRHQRGMESRLKQARFPWVKTLEQFDFGFQPGIDRKVVRELAGLAFVERSENVILLGPPGVGKTHLAVALGVKAADAGHRVLFMPLDKLIATLMKAKQENRLEKQLQQLGYARVYGVEWPSGHNVRWVRDEMSSLVLLTDTPWYPPSGELVGEISKVFDCEIRHWYSEPVRGIQGYNCYDGGEHTDSDPQAEWPGRETLPQPRLYLVEERAEEQTEAAPLPVPLASGQ
ncbi:transposition helper protein, IS21 family [Escherichia coli O139:H28 str. E24377A]|uniref:Transposition helper protein, IS21 family n=6 Tax=Enterobacteriaceae TaxID=543 RepID=A7ZRE1_ECO24|nr:ATP-binding protein [Escherichia coli]ABV19510.1 transposition helper protein, IS21 family [Escherichia coli O139:H28 str. E24377A]